MTMYWLELFFLTVIIVLTDYWFWKQMRRHKLYEWFVRASLVPGVLFILNFLYIRFAFKYNHDYRIAASLQWVFYMFMTIYIPKLIYILFHFLNKLYNQIFDLKAKFIRQAGFILSVLIVGFLMYGTVVTRDKFKLTKKVIEVKDLPPSFEGYKIAVFADFHLGNWNRRYKIMKPILKMINGSHPDIIVFAGDLVNNFPNETEGWEPYFRQMKSRQGNFAIMGNHDYGDYTAWKTEDRKKQNLEAIKNNIRKMGFKLMLNEHTELINGTDTVTLVGVENWSRRKHFRRYGDLKKALTGTNPNRKKILLSHDPDHWEAEVIGKKDIFLTISGHTHAGQIGYLHGDIRISPASLVFNQWEGAYEKDDQTLYVTSGIGYVGIPLRLGVRPEVVLIELRRK